jgi:8-oxo-dGTP pyrophosphatase MutT (NUDIX family)
MRPPDDRTTRIDAGIVDIVVLTPVDASIARRPADRWRVLTLRRGEGTRCTGGWEIVHGRVEAGERPADAARREVLEETGLPVQRLYSVTVNPFYLHQVDTIHLAMVFAAVVKPAPIVLGPEHDASAWRSPRAANGVLAWPREHQAVRYAVHLLRRGDAGVVEDVLRIP